MEPRGKSNPFNLKWVKDRVYALGTWFYKDLDQIIQENYKAKFEIFVSILKQWQIRKLTLFGKITVLKSLAMSKLNYCIATLETPEWFTEQVQNEINKFIWNGKPPKIKYKTAIAKQQDGGLKVPDIHTYILSQKALWAKRLFNSKSMHFLPYLEDFLPVMCIRDILNLSINVELLAISIPLFYRQVLYAWYLVSEKELTCIADVLKEILWLNKSIMIDNESVAYDDWYTEGCVQIHDLINDNGHFFHYDEFIQRYDINCTQFKYMSLVDAIPKEWKAIIKSHRDEIINIERSEEIIRTFGLSTKEINKIASKDIYWKLLKNKIEKPTCISSWNKKYGLEFSECEWKQIFKLSKNLTRDVRVIEFQTKIIHRIYASNSYVSRFDKTVQENCTECNIKCDICHMFYSCKHIKEFWLTFTTWWNRHFRHKIIQLSLIDVIFGILLPKCVLINYCILHAKWFLHKEYKKFDNNSIKPSFDNYLYWLKEVVKIERYVAEKNGSIDSFHEIFNVLEMCF